MRMRYKRGKTVRFSLFYVAQFVNGRICVSKRGENALHEPLAGTTNVVKCEIFVTSWSFMQKAIKAPKV